MLKKRLISLLIIIAIVFTTVAVPVPENVHGASNVITWTEGVTGGAIYFDPSTGMITDCDETVTEVVIPGEINGVQVTSIGYMAFSYCDSLSSITIPNSVTSIGDRAFYNCDSLSSITIPNSVTSIGEYAFSGCDSLSSITIPNSVTSIGADAFSNCDSLSSITIPNSVTSIGEYAFSYCDSLSSITIPDSVTSIGDAAFYNCYGLSSITIPNSVTSIGVAAFSYCDSLSSITVDRANSNYASDEGVLFNKDKSLLIQYPIGNSRMKYTIPDSVTSIGEYAFYYCDSLSSITIPDSVTSIGEYAFSGCDSLSSITIPNSVTSIGDDTFSNCNSLTIYGYSGSYAESYAYARGISFKLIDGTISAPKITERDLYGEYARYLTNEAYKNMCGTLLTDVEKILWSKSDKDIAKAGFITCLKNGALKNLKAIYNSATGNFNHEKELEKEIALELVYRVSGCDPVIDDVIGDLKDAYDLTSDANSFMNDVMEHGAKTASDKFKVAKAISGGLFSESDAYVLLETVEKNADAINESGVLDYVDATVDGVNIAVNIAMSMDANHCVTQGIRQGIANRNDSALFRGLTELIKMQKKSVKENTLDELLKYSADKIFGAFIDVLSGAFAPVEFAFNIVGTCMGKKDIDAFNKVVITSSNSSVLYSAKENAQVAMVVNYRDGNKISPDELGKGYRLLYTAYLESIKQSVEYALTIATPAQKKKLQKHYNEYKDYLTYEKYLQSCLGNVTASWSYTIEDEKATITSVSQNTGASQAKTADNDIIIDVPSELNGYAVAKIGSNAFKGNTSLACVALPDTITNIGNSSFEGCTSLKSIYLNDELSTIEESAFKDCTSMSEVSLPYAVKQIENDAFAGIESVNFEAVEGSAGQEYAETAENATWESKELKAISLEVTKTPDKMTYKMSEEFDSTGISVIATYEDGSQKDVSEESYCEFVEKKIGENTINVHFNELSVSFSVEVVADECSYTVSYEDEFGNEIAEPVEGMALAGTEISLPIKEISGYIPDETELLVTIESDNDFIVTYSSTPRIDISEASVDAIAPQNYTGSQICPEIEVKLDDTLLNKDVDYYVDYDENLDAGTGRILLTGTGNYTGMKWIEFSIVSKDIESCKLTLSETNNIYDGNAKEPIITVEDSDGNLLGDGIDYTVRYKNNVNAGTATVIVEGKGNYEGTLTKTFTIKLAKPTGVKVTTISSSGKPKVTWNKVEGADKYQVYRKVGSNGTYKLFYTTTGTSVTNTSATPGTVYYYKVKAIHRDEDCNSAFSVEKYIACDLAQPTGVTLTTIASSGKPKLTWNKVSGATKYEVWRKVGSSGTYGKYYTTTGTSMTNNSATPGKVYYYKVKAICGKNSGGNSAFSTAKYIACDLARPTGVKVTTIASSGKPKVTWNKVSGASKYEVWRKVGSNGTYKKFYTTTGTSMTNKSATAGKVYYYKVKAICGKNSGGNSAFSVSDYVTCDLAKPKITVSGTQKKGKIVISWNKVTGADRYYIYRATSKNGTYKKYDSTTKTTYTNTQVTRGKYYYYKVKAVYDNRSAANSAYSNMDYAWVR